jgi:hypothetical protein
MIPTSTESDDIARQYLLCAAELSRDDQDPDSVWEPEINPAQRAYDLVNDTIRRGPSERAWELVTAVLRLAPDERLGHLAAGPLEDLVKRHGEALVDRMESEAARDERFRWALGGIWLREADLPVAELRRIVAASDDRIKVLEWLPMPPQADPPA